MKKSGTGNATYRGRLVERREQVLAELGMKLETLAGMGRVAEDDAAQIAHDEFISLQRNTLGYAQLRLVEEALKRLDSGEYGICPACEEPIAEKRLHALPWARYCVKCQENAGANFDREREPVGV